MLYSSIFKTIEDGASSSGYKITSIFSQLFSDIRSNSHGITFSTGFSETLNNDISCITAYQNAVAAGTEAATAFDNSMLTASMSAVEYATSMDASKLSVAEFATQQRQAEIATIAQGTSLKNVKSLIAEYNSGCVTTGVSQEQFVDAVSQSNSNLGKYLSGLDGAKASAKGYISSLISAKAATIGMRLATMALNTAISAGIAALVGAAAQVLSYWINKAKEAREATLEAASATKDETENIQEAYQAYRDAYIAYSNGTGTKDAYTSATESLCDALGVEESKVASLTAKYGDLDAAINEVTLSELKNDLQDLTDGFTAAQDELIDAVDGSFWSDGLTTYIDYSTDTLSDKVADALDELDNSFNKVNSSFFVLDGNFDDVKGITEVYDDISRYEELFEKGVEGGYYTREELANSKLYRQIEERKKSFEEEYEAYLEYADSVNETSASIEIIDYINENGVPETVEQYSALETAILGAADASGSFVGSQDDIISAIKRVLSSFPGLEDFYGASYKDKIESYFSGDGVADTIDTAAKADDMFASEYFEDAETRVKLLKESLMEAAQQGELTAEDIDKLGISIDGVESSDIAQYFNDMAAAATNASDATSKLTSAMQAFEDAQDDAQSGDNFQTALEALEHINDVLNNNESDDYGRTGTSVYEKALEYVIPDSVDRDNESAVNAYLQSIADLFTFDEDGNLQGLNIYNFCKEAVEKGLMAFDESSNSFVNAGSRTMEDFATGMGLSLELVENIFGEIEEFGGNFAKDGTFSSILASYAQKYLSTMQSYGNLGSYTSSSESSTTTTSSSGDGDDTATSSTSIIDWIEIAIDRFQRAADKLKNIATSSFRSMRERISATNDEMAQLTAEINLQQEAYNRYIAEANSVGLADNLAEAVRLGAIDINEYDKETADLISQYQKWYEKALDCSEAIDELSESLKQLYVDNFNNTASQYDYLIEEIEHRISMLDTQMSQYDQSEYANYDENSFNISATRSYYDELINRENSTIANMEQELGDLRTQYYSAMANGVAQGSEAWEEMRSKIYEVEEALESAKSQVISYKDALKELYVTSFNNTASSYEDVILSMYEHKMSVLEEYLNRLSQSTYITPDSNNTNANSSFTYYEKLIRGEELTVKQLKKELASLQSEMNTAVNSGAIKSGSAAWAEMNDKIQDVELSIQQSTTAITEYEESIASLYETMFNNIVSKYDITLSAYENKMSVLNEYITQLESSSYSAIETNNAGLKKSVSYYSQLISSEYSTISQLENERDELQTQLNKALESGSIKSGSEAWAEMRDKINEVDLAILQANTSIQEYSESIKEVYKQLFDNVATSYDSKLSEIEHRATLVNDAISRAAQSTQKEVNQNNDNALSNISSYRSLISYEESTISSLKNERQELVKAFNTAIANGIEVGSDAWTEMRDKIYEVDEAISEATTSIQEYEEAIIDLYITTFDNIESNANNKLSQIEHTISTVNGLADYYSTIGLMESATLYNTLISAENSNLKLMKQELTDLEDALNTAVDNGLEEGSQDWYDMMDSINSVKESIQESTTAVEEYKNAIRQIEWDRFDYGQELISGLTNEADFLIDLMSNSDLFDDKGNFSDTGMATVGLRGLNYNTYMAQADQYAEEAAKIKEALESDPYDTELISRYKELIELQQEAISSAEDEKQAIIDLVEEGIEAELSALQDVIDKYNDALDSAKDLYDYQKTLKTQTSEIASLQKQLTAYQGDTSEETKATIQKLSVSLEDAQEELEETEYEHYISEQKKMLDNLYDEYEEVLNQRLDDVDALIAEMIDSVNTNSTGISETINTAAESVGYTLSESMSSIWGSFTSPLSTYYDGFKNEFTTTNTTLSSILLYLANMYDYIESIASASSSSGTPTTNASSGSGGTGSNGDGDTTSSQGTSTLVVGDVNGSGTVDTSDALSILKYVVGLKEFTGDQITAADVDGDGYVTTKDALRVLRKVVGLKTYATGGLVDYTGIAQLDGSPSNPEMVLSPSDTANFIALKDALKEVAAGKRLQTTLFGNDEALSDVISKLSDSISVDNINNQTGGDTTYNISIPIDHVQDYEDFVNQLRTDGKFEKLIQSMTTDRLSGGSRIAKSNYRW